MTDTLGKFQQMEEQSAFDLAQYEVLGKFYEAWEALHAIPPGKLRQKEKEAAAEHLVELAHMLRRMRDDKPKLLVPRFMQ
ncbi:MAG TPA: hypothetical protein VF516_03270 [Kofleriaceae bacterium]